MSQSFKYCIFWSSFPWFICPLLLTAPVLNVERKKGVVKKQLRYAKSDMVYQLFISKGG